MADQEDVNEDSNRGLDNAPTSSMDIQSLNNMVVSLRGLMKKVQLFTIQKLVRQSKQLRTQKGTVENQKKLKKAERLVQEVGSMKDIKIDHVIKYALGNTKTFEEVAGKADLDTRAKVRLATHPLMLEKVKTWRGEHEDWKALAAFVLYKNTGRRYKKKKKKDAEENSAEKSTSTEKPAKLSKTPKSKSKEEEVKESTPSKRKLVVPKIGDGESAKTLARRAKTIRNRQNYEDAEIAYNDTSKSTEPSRAVVPPTIPSVESSKNKAKAEEDDGSVSSEEDDSSMETEGKVDNEEDDSSMETEEKVDDEVDDSSEEDEVSETEETKHTAEDVKSVKKVDRKVKNVTEDTKQRAEDVKTVTKVDRKVKTVTEKTKQRAEDVKSVAKVDRKVKTVKSDTKDVDDSDNESSEEESDSGESDNEESEESPKEETKPIKLKPQPKPIGYKAGKEMAIKKIDLTALSEEVEDIPVEADVSFLFTASKADDIPKPKPKRKDAFFAMDSGEEEDEDDEVEKPKKTAKAQREKISYDNDVGMQRKTHHKKIESAFVGRLSDKQAKGDWGYGKGSFSRPAPEEQAPSGRGRGGASSRGRADSKSNQGEERSKRAGYGIGGASDVNGSTGSKGSQKQTDQPAKEMYDGADDGKLHPSWEAKRKRKELESQIVQFKGKKIKFDD